MAVVPGRLWLDMDGVLADFDRHYESEFGLSTGKGLDLVDWDLVRGRKHFYRDIPPMPDMMELWSAVAHLNPVILTGIPYSVEEAEANKREWADLHFPGVHVTCCLSREKYKHALMGDCLVDDRPRYQGLWEQAGGVWITHISAADTIKRLKDLRWL
jgi:hypothetical protein